MAKTKTIYVRCIEPLSVEIGILYIIVCTFISKSLGYIDLQHLHMFGFILFYEIGKWRKHLQNSICKNLIYLLGKFETQFENMIPCSTEMISNFVELAQQLSSSSTRLCVSNTAGGNFMSHGIGDIFNNHVFPISESIRKVNNYLGTKNSSITADSSINVNASYFWHFPLKAIEQNGVEQNYIFP